MTKTIMKEGWETYKEQLLQDNEGSAAMRNVVDLVEAIATELEKLLSRYEKGHAEITGGLIVGAITNGMGEVEELFTLPLTGELYRGIVYQLLLEWLKEEYAVHFWDIYEAGHEQIRRRTAFKVKRLARRTK